MTKLIQCITALLLFTVSFETLAQETRFPFHGETKRKIVSAQVGDSFITVEYCYANISGAWFTKFDTLKKSDHFQYIGKFSRIEIQNKNILFKPGNICLLTGNPDSSLNQNRNLGYSYFLHTQLNKALTWTGADLSEFKSKRWNQGLLTFSNPESFKQVANYTFDSLCTYYRSKLYIQNFGKLVIKDYRIIPKRYIESSDSVEIYKIWGFLAKASVCDKKNFSYLIQLPIPIAAVSIIDFDIALLALPFSYPLLIGTEIFIGNRLCSTSTYKIKFYPKSKGNSKLTLKVRKSKIIGNNFTYQLTSDFKTMLPSL